MMDFLDYRELLNIGFDDRQKQLYFLNKALNIFEALCVDGRSHGISVGEYFKFCEFTGTRINCRLANGGRPLDFMKDCFRILEEHTADTKDFIAHGVCKSCQGQSCHAFFMPEAKNKIYPLHMALGVTAVIPKQFVGSGKGLVQERDQSVSQHSCSCCGPFIESALDF